EEMGGRFVERREEGGAEGRGEWENGVEAGETRHREGPGGGRKRPLPRSATVAAENELATEGGEVAFVGRLIDESTRLRSAVKFYTTMLGKKSSVAALLGRLAREAEGEERLRFTSGELRQGRTQRWLLIWTFCEEVKLPVRPASLDLVVRDRTRDGAMQWIRDLLSALRIDIVADGEDEEEEGEGRRLECRVTAPTWLRKARKRRRRGKKEVEVHSNAVPVTPSVTVTPFTPLSLTVTARAPVTVTSSPSVTLVFGIEDDSRKRDLSQLVVHLANKLLVAQ
ncbi:hypothetical protein PENTCL1PPCAC_13017, partial [Pristionchus entomophagus]